MVDHNVVLCSRWLKIGVGLMPSKIEQRAVECRRRAAEFKQMAENACLPTNRDFLLEMAEHWLVLAQSYAVNEHMERATERLNGVSARMNALCQRVDAQSRQLGIQYAPQRRERVRGGRQLTGLRLVVNN